MNAGDDDVYVTWRRQTFSGRVLARKRFRTLVSYEETGASERNFRWFRNSRIVRPSGGE